MTMTITMREPARSEDGLSVLLKGSTYTVSRAFGARLVQLGFASTTDPIALTVTPSREAAPLLQRLSSGQVALALPGGIELDLTGLPSLAAPWVVPQFLGTYGGVTMDAGSGNVLPVLRATVNAPTDVIAGQRIISNTGEVFSTTITGASAGGEVLVLSTGAVNITSAHVGSSSGASFTLSSDATITVNELVRFDFLDADNVNLVRLMFSPPRGSGRYVDVSCIGVRRAA